jgi:hypothetical protein
MNKHDKRGGFVDSAHTQVADGKTASGLAKPKRSERSRGDESQIETDSREIAFMPVGERHLRRRILGGKEADRV